MQLVTYRYAVGHPVAWRQTLRQIAGVAPPSWGGLASRHWRIDGKALCGYYLFQDEAALKAFTANPNVDAAFGLIAGIAAEPLQDRALIENIGPLDVIDRPLFVIAAPRSGSTLLYDLLRHSSELWSLDGESEGIIEGVAALHPAARNFDSHRLTDLDADDEARRFVTAGLLAGLRDRSNAHYLGSADHTQHLSVRVVEKTPENCLRVPFLAATFPTARFVFLHRDARQAVSSICQAWRHVGFVKYPELPGWDMRSWHLLLPEGWRELNSASVAEVAAFQWASANRQALDDFEALPMDSWMSIDYAELVATPIAVIRRICAFAEIGFDERLAAALARPLPLSNTTITPPSPIKWRSNPDFRESALDPYTSTSARLRDLGKLSAPPPPPRTFDAAARFSCFVDEVPAATAAATGEMIVAPSFHFQFGPTVPLRLVSKTRYRGRFLADHPLLWVDDPATGMTYPYWVRRHQAWVYREFVAGLPPPAGIEDDLARRIAVVGVLATHEDLERRRRAGDSSVEEAHAEFVRTGYCVLPSVVPAPQVKGLGRYYRTLVAAGDWAAGDEQVRLRHGWHNEAVARYFHHQLAGVVSRVTGEAVKPTYCYVSAYGEGAVLRPHVDRKQCTFTVSLWLDNGANLPAETWPLWFQTDIGKVPVTQQSGDAVVFLGCDLPHWREAPPAGAVST